MIALRMSVGKENQWSLQANCVLGIRWLQPGAGHFWVSVWRGIGWRLPIYFGAFPSSSAFSAGVFE